MIGIDLTNINRFEAKSIDFIKHFLHPEEILIYHSTKNKPLFLATRWAIKEALFKIDNKLGEFSKINIKKSQNKYFYKNFFITTSHEDNYIIALAHKGINDEI